MKIVIPGGTGQIGRILGRSFAAEGHDVVILTRRKNGRRTNTQQTQMIPDGMPREPRGTTRLVKWDARSCGPWTNELDGADVVINLAGRSVDCRYHAANRRAMMSSRVESTRALGRAIAEAKAPPRVWLQASTATIYAHSIARENDETTGVIGGAEPCVPDSWRFSIDVAKAWEQAAGEVQLPATRLVLMRSAMTMSPDEGGVFDVLLRLVRFGLGGKHGDGRQFVSWIHERDFFRAVRRLIDDDDLTGPVNLAAPHPVPNAEFMRTLRIAWGWGLGLPTARWMLEAAAFVLRTETELILKSRRVVPGKLLEAGFEFEFPTWNSAAEDLCRGWRQRRREGVTWQSPRRESAGERRMRSAATR